MPPTPEQEGISELMTITEIAEMVGRSRQLIHRLATTDPTFPSGVLEPGSTRPKYQRAAISEWWANRDVRQGRRTDLEKKRSTEE